MNRTGFNPAAACVHESDGFHQHEYTVGNQTVIENLHAWMDGHRAQWPDAADNEIRLGQTHRPFRGSAVEAWQSLTDSPMPTATCGVA